MGLPEPSSYLVDLPAPLALPVLDTLLAAAPVGFAVLDRELRYLAVNEALAEINGVPVADHLGRTLAEVVPGAALSAAPVFRQVLDTGRPAPERLLSGELPKAPGERRSWLVTAYPVAGDGRPHAVAVLVWDVTDRERSEREQGQTLALLETLLLQAPVGLAFLDRDLRYLRVNETLAGYNGHPVAAHLGRRLREMVPDAEPLEPLVEQVLASGRPVVGLEAGTGDGTPQRPHRQFQVSFYPVPTPGTDVPFGVGLVVTDVTESRRIQRQRAEAARRLALLSQATALVAGSLDLSRMLSDLAVLTVPAFADHCYLELAETLGDRVVLRRFLAVHAEGAGPDQEGGDAHQPGDIVEYPPGHPARRALDTGTTVLEPIDDRLLSAAPTPGALNFARRVGMRGVVAAPLVSGGTVIGVVSFVASVSQRTFEEDDRALAEELAARASTAVANARAYEREQRARTAAEAAESRLRLLADASEALAGSLRRDEILEVALDLLVPRVADWCVVYLRGEDDEIRLEALRHQDPRREPAIGEFLAHLPITPDVRGVGQSMATGEAVLLPAIDELMKEQPAPDPEQAERRRAVPMRSGLSAPLTARGRTFGALGLIRERGRDYTAAELTLLEDLAGRVALALDNARLYAAQRDVAVALQRSLLPQAPKPGPGLVVAARYLPGAEGAEVGGDWYDVIRLDGDRTGIVIGDVMGRGIRAAAVMGQLRAALRGYALEGHSPGDALRRLDLVVGGLDELNLTTCVYAVYDPHARTLTAATAGHLPPLLAEPGGPPRFVELDPTLPLGVGADGLGPGAERTIPVAPGSLLLLYTDGLVEEATTPIDTGMARLAAALTGATGSPDEACDRALAALTEHGHHDDDTALLAVLTDARLDAEAASPRVARVELSSSPRSARAAREFVTRTLRAWDAGALEHTTTLLVSELVANAVRHAASTVELQLTAGARALTVAVSDASPELPSTRGADLDAEHGRGMLLVDQMADRWGADRHPNGKRVWFELTLPEPGAQGAPQTPGGSRARSRRPA